MNSELTNLLLKACSTLWGKVGQTNSNLAREIYDGVARDLFDLVMLHTTCTKATAIYQSNRGTGMPREQICKLILTEYAK